MYTGISKKYKLNPIISKIKIINPIFSTQVKHILILAIIFSLLFLLTSVISRVNTINAFSVNGGTPFDSTIFNLDNPSTLTYKYPDAPVDSFITSCPSGAIGNTIQAGNLLMSGQDLCLSINAQMGLARGDSRLYAYMAERSEGYIGGGLGQVVFAMNKLILDQQPLSGAEFVESKVYALTNPGKVMAQDDPTFYYRGTGFDLLKPIQGFWSWSVNIVYGFLTLIIIGVAFAIMFRDKIGGAASVTIQTAIPNIALAMLLVPLSYAISGFILDGMAIGLNVTHQFVFGPGAPGRKVYENRNDEFKCYSTALTGLVDDCLGPDGNDRGLFADDIRVSWLYAGSYIFPEGTIMSFAEPIIFSNGINTALGSLSRDLTGLVASVLNLVIQIVLLINGLKILILLLEKFLLFIIGPIFSPFFFAAIAIPGQGMASAVNYIKLMLSGVAFFVIAYGMTLFALVFASASFKSQVAALGIASFQPPMTGFEGFFDSLSSGAGGQVPVSLVGFYMTLVAIAIYFSIPPFLKSIDESWGTKLKPPAFLLGAWENAKDSFNLAKKGATGIYNAPGNLQKGFDAVRNIGSRINQKRVQLGQGALNLADRARGINPGEQGSSAFGRAQKYKDAMEDAERKRQMAIQNGNWAQARYFQSRKNAYSRQLKNVTENAPQAGEGNKDLLKKIAEEGASLELQVLWNGQNVGGYITMSKEQIEDIRKRVAGGDKGSYRISGAGKIQLTGKNVKLGPNVLKRLELYDITSPSNDALKNSVGKIDSSRINIPTQPTGTSFVSAGGPPVRPRSLGNVASFGARLTLADPRAAQMIFDREIQFPAAPGGICRINYDVPHISAKGDGTWAIDFSIEILEIRTFVLSIRANDMISTRKFKLGLANFSPMSRDREPNRDGDVISNEMGINLQFET